MRADEVSQFLLDALVSHTRLTMDSLEKGVDADPSLGHPPRTIYVQQFRFVARNWEKGAFAGEPLRMWAVTEKEVREEPVDQPDFGERDGMYYQRGWLGFTLSEDGTSAIVGWQVGPRYGRGYVVPVEYLAEEVFPSDHFELLWVS